MAYLAVKDKSSSNKTFSGSEFIGLNKGTHYLCVRTGPNTNDVVKYGLTTNTSASAYCKAKLNAGGTFAYIARVEGTPDTYYYGVVKNLQTTGVADYPTMSNSWGDTQMAHKEVSQNITMAQAMCRGPLDAQVGGGGGSGYKYIAINGSFLNGVTSAITKVNQTNLNAYTAVDGRRVANTAESRWEGVPIYTNGEFFQFVNVSMTYTYVRTCITTCQVTSITRTAGGTYKNNQNL